MFEHFDELRREHPGDRGRPGDGRGPRRHGRDFDDPFGGGPGRGHRRPGGGRMRRGEIRTAVLAILVDGPGHGYDLIQRLEEKSGGWRPSPGSIYPTLQLLEDEDLVRSVERDGKRVFELTDEGRAEAERRIAEGGGAPWERESGMAPSRELREQVGQSFAALRQIGFGGSPAQVERAVAVLKETRKQLYQILAED
jgi:DNA-binding PadR family transcriptional regulator